MSKHSIGAAAAVPGGPAPAETVNVKTFFDQRPMSRRQWLLLALCFLVVAADGIDVAIMGFIAPPIMQEWGLSKGAFGVVMTAAPVGLVIGALASGPLSDLLGRRIVLLGATLAFGVFTLLTAYSGGATEMAFWRFMTGIGLGAAMPNTTTLLAEYVPERHRSLMIGVMYTGFGAGSALVGFAAASMVPAYGWRSVLLAGGALPLLILPLLWFWVPESVRFMVARGRSADLIARTLSKVSGVRFAPGVQFVAPEPPLASRRPIGVLFSPGYAALTVSLWVTYFCGLLVIYLATGWLPTLFKESGLSISQAATITAMFQTGGIVGVLVTGWAMDKGRPTLVIASAYLLGALCLFGISRIGVVAPTLAWWVLAAGLFINGAQTGLNALAPSRYPTVARATGVAWMQGMGRFGSIVGSSVGGLLIGSGWGFSAVVGILAVPTLIAATAVLAGGRRSVGEVAAPVVRSVEQA